MDICIHPIYTVEFQWLKHSWLVYYGHLELILESLTKKKKNPIAADIIVFGIILGDFLFILIMVCCVYSLELPR